MLSLSVCFAGLSMYSKYHDCDPIEQGRIESHDMLLPRYVVDTMAHIPGASGLFIAGNYIFSQKFIFLICKIDRDVLIFANNLSLWFLRNFQCWTEHNFSGSKLVGCDNHWGLHKALLQALLQARNYTQN